MANGFKKDDFIVNQPGNRVALVRKVERRQIIDGQDMSGYLIQFADGSTLSNAPGYLMRAATEAEVEAAARAAGLVPD